MSKLAIKAVAAATVLWLPATAFASNNAPDYSRGVFFVNEDWYGHQNSTVNYLLPDDPDGDYWHYRVIQAQNPGKELGCTNQYGAIWGGRFYLIAKQEKDPGASVKGGRISVADASTMELLFQSDIIDPSGRQCDGRGFVGVDAHKGYISTSNGVWVFNLDTYTVTGQVSGSANPNVGDDKPNTDPTGSLYYGQCGTMVEAAGKIFAAHQQYGLLVIDPAQDKVVATVKMDIIDEKAGIGSVVKSRDGQLWLSVARNTQGTGASLPYLVRLNPATLATEVIPIPEGIEAPNNSWYAWTPDAFCASQQGDYLIWKGGANRWFAGNKVYRYDIPTRRFSLLIDLSLEEGNWNLYGCSMRIHPESDEIYMSVFHQFQDPTYSARRYSSAGVLLKEYPMISNYWFPSLPVFPQDDPLAGIEAPAVNRGESISVEINGGMITVVGAEGLPVAVHTLAGIPVGVETATSGRHTLAVRPAPGVYFISCGGIHRKLAI